MKYFIKKGNTYKELDVREKNGVFIVTDGEKSYTVDLKPINSKNFSILVDHQSYTLEAEFHNTTLRLAWEQRQCQLEVLNERQKLESEIYGDAELGGSSGEIVAPMPGLILKVEVKEGDTVENGQPLLVMEAMKMENEIRSTLNGTVQKIFVSPNQTVEKDDPLILIQP
ncbi:MAG: biotin/lipoyl-binding protein [Calditrichaeota bacterium]|nr:MAG: biotin/lipoyl-binding protein [Calditrichota bacterium]